MVKIEVVYVPVHLTLELQSGATVFEALNASGIYSIHPETRDFSVGIYGKQVSLDTVLKEGDRVEIYRPLVLDPKEKRRQRAKITRLKTNQFL